MNSLFWNGMVWHQLIYPEHALDEVGGPALVSSFEGDYPDYAACLCLDGYARLPRERKAQVMEAVAGLIRAALPEHLRRVLGFTHTNAFYFCGNLDERGREGLPPVLDGVRRKAARLSGLSATLGIAFTRGRSREDWSRAAQLAVVSQRRKVRMGGNRTYVYEESFLADAFSLSAHWSLGERLTSLVREGDPTRAEGVLAEVSRVLFDENYLPLKHLRPILQSYIILMAESAREVDADDGGIAAETGEYLSRLDATWDYPELKAILEEAALDFTRRVHDRYSCPAGRMVSRVEEIVKAGLEDPDLALHGIAGELGVNPSYLSRRFKQEKGLGLSEYINLQRVEMARRLLLDRKLGIAEIAYAVGFGSTQNFGRVFRAAQGCSPSQYRRAKSFQNE